MLLPSGESLEIKGLSGVSGACRNPSLEREAGWLSGETVPWTTNQERSCLTDRGGSAPILTLLPSWAGSQVSRPPPLNARATEMGSVSFPLLPTEIPGLSFGRAWLARVLGGLGSTGKRVGLFRRGVLLTQRSV